MIEPLPEPAPAPVPARPVRRAAVSPSALVLAGAGIGVALLAGLPVTAAVAVGAGCWAVRVAAAVVVAARRRRRPRREQIDPFAVPEPWRHFVQAAVVARAKFDQTVSGSKPGPLQDRLREIGRRVDDSAWECWRYAREGAALNATLATMDTGGISRQLRQVQEQRRHPSGAAAELDRTEAALATQLRAARRVQQVAEQTADKLRVLSAKLDGAVAGVVEVSLSAADAGAASQLAGQLDAILAELEALRQGIEETTGWPPPAGPVTP